MNSFLDVFQNLQDLAPERQEQIRSSVEEIQVSKGEVLQRTGDKNTYAYFVKEGLIRSFIIDYKGKEHIYMFAPEGWIAADLEHFDKLPNAELNIDALEDSVLERVNRRHMYDFFQEIGEERFQIEVQRLMNRVVVLQKRVLMLMSATAAERYEHFLKTYPQIVQRAPQKMIASYLGITPEALSKVKGELLRK